MILFVVIGSLFLNLYRTCIVPPLSQLRATTEMMHRRQKMQSAKFRIQFRINRTVVSISNVYNSIISFTFA